MFDNVAHPGLRALLSFEATRHGLPIEYREVDVIPTSSTPFVPRVEVLTYSGKEVGAVDLCVNGTTVPYSGPLACACGLLDDEIRVGDVLVGGVVRNRIVLRFSLESLFLQGDRPVGDVSDPTVSSMNAAHQVFDAIFSQALPIAVRNVREHDWKAEADAYVRMKLDVLDRSVRAWKEEISRNDRDIDEKTWQIMGLVTRSARLREALEGFQDATRMQHRRKAVEEHGELVRMLGSGAIRALSCDGGRVEFETGKVKIDYDEYEYVLGPFRIEMSLTDASLRIVGMHGAPKVDGYTHPHVSSTGTPCLGNMAPVIAKTLGCGDVVGAISAVLEFLRAYNHGNGYVDLMRWNPDYENEDDRFESCYDNSSCHDCVVCGDSDCPYRDGAEHRCWENHDQGDCIDCGDCSYRDTAITTCRGEHEPWECTECSQACTYAGDISDCHEQGRCGDCPLTDCARHPDKDKENDTEPAAEPAAA
jgi:hypothetical protein